MPAKGGLFTRQEVKAKAAKKGRGKLPASSLHRYGLAAVEMMNPEARTKHMEAWGDDNPDLYVLSECPGVEEDKKGRPFVGNSGRYLLPLIERASFRLNNCCRTLPQLRKQNGKKSRRPIYDEVEAYRPSVEADIIRSRPKLILALGDISLKWCIETGSQDNVADLRGRLFKRRFGDDLDVWVLATWHPAYLLRQLDDRSAGKGEVPAREKERFFLQDVKRACGIASRFERPEIWDPGIDELVSGYDPICTDGDLKTLERYLDNAGDELALDTETHGLRPYNDDSELLTIGIGTGDEGVSVAVAHPGCGYTSRGRKRLAKLLASAVTSGRNFRIHNAPFDMEWLEMFVAEGAVWRSTYECTQAMAYVLDSRSGGQSLNVLAQQHLGCRVKSITGVDRAALSDAPLQSALQYQAGDTKTHWRLYDAMRSKIDEGRKSAAEVYAAQRDRIPSVVMAQVEGFPVSQRRVELLGEEVEPKLESVEAKIRKSRWSRAYKRRFRKTFSSTSPKAISSMFGDIIGAEPDQHGKYGSKEEDLERYDHPFARLVLKAKKLDKLRGTYVDRLLIGHDKSHVFPDGRIHCNYNLTFTATGRLSSSNPNTQNYPKRDPEAKKMRRVFVAPRDHYFVEIDFGQLEARVIAMQSGDPNLIASIWDGDDIHGTYTDVIAAACPQVLERFDNSWKRMRQDLKTSFVFSSFYGSSMDSVARRLKVDVGEIEPVYDDFWTRFARVKAWGEEMIENYRQLGWTFALNGRARPGPMSDFMVVNSPIQGQGSDIVVDGMARLGREAFELGWPALQPWLNIHDALVFCVHKSELDDLLQHATATMLNFRAPWMTVPLSVEATIGKNWCDMGDEQTFTSDVIHNYPLRPDRRTKKRRRAA